MGGVQLNDTVDGRRKSGEGAMVLNCLQGILGECDRVCNKENNERDDQERQMTSGASGGGEKSEGEATYERNACGRNGGMAMNGISADSGETKHVCTLHPIR